MKAIAVYCGSSAGNDAVYVRAAKSLGRLFAQRGITLVYGGGSVGLMGAVSNSVLEHGGRVVGVIPRFLQDLELGHSGLTEMVVVETMHERKREMIDRAQGFIALPGGLGTLEEITEVLAWSQLGLHSYPCGMLNVNGFFDGLIACCEEMVRTGFVRKDDRRRLMASESPETLLEKMEQWQPPTQLKWEQPAPSASL